VLPELPLPPPSQAWAELLSLAQDEAGERAMLERGLELWRLAYGAASAGLYLDKGGTLELEVASGPAPLPAILDQNPRPDAAAADGAGSSRRWLRLAAGGLLYIPAAAGADSFVPADEVLAGDPLTLLLAAALKSCRLRHELKDQQFQVNYRVVELESLYDVGLAVAATLDRERLSEEILLRAVSLLDARRGALYVLESDRYLLDRTFGGDAAASFELDHPGLAGFLAGTGDPPADLLPGARYLLGVPIAIESSPRGLLAVGDKESRRGVGPFPVANRRTLELFANQAAIALENARLHLQALEKERLESEMSLAAEIQRQILPHGAPVVPGFQVCGWNRPARQVGGDYYDLFLRDDGRFGMVVGDVSGKGMPAALMVSTLHSALRLLFDQTGFGPTLLERLNRHILDSSAANKFITLLLAQLDPGTGDLLYLNAGHNPGLLLRRGGEVVELGSSGLPLGLLPGSRFQARSLIVGPGDLLCLYTDGITEAEAPSEEEFGLARLLATLREHQDLSLPMLLEAIQEATAGFSQGRPQGDDQTLVLLRRDP
jgi:sigma-B regulation protein RsbU (phosphoserine phosphatase)